MTLPTRYAVFGPERWAPFVKDVVLAGATLGVGEACGPLFAKLGHQAPVVPSVAACRPAQAVIVLGALDHLDDLELTPALARLSECVERHAFVVLHTDPARRPMRLWLRHIEQHFEVRHAQEFEGQDFVLLLARRKSTPAPREAVRLFIGSEPRQWVAAAVLRFSIERHCSPDFIIESMDYARGGLWGGWQTGRTPGRPASVSVTEAGQSVWSTDFSNFRWAIPEACGFSGRAIYMDSDQLVLRDPRELWETPMSASVLSLNQKETSVMLLDCTAFRGIPGWPTVAEMKTNGWGIETYRELLARAGAFGALPSHWNCLDGRGYEASKTGLIHYTDMGTQPWRPYPERVAYRTHPHPEVERLWFEYATRARNAGWFEIVPQILYDQATCL